MASFFGTDSEVCGCFVLVTPVLSYSFLLFSVSFVGEKPSLKSKLNEAVDIFYIRLPRLCVWSLQGMNTPTPKFFVGCFYLCVCVLLVLFVCLFVCLLFFLFVCLFVFFFVFCLVLFFGGEGGGGCGIFQKESLVTIS